MCVCVRVCVRVCFRGIIVNKEVYITIVMTALVRYDVIV